MALIPIILTFSPANFNYVKIGEIAGEVEINLSDPTDVDSNFSADQGALDSFRDGDKKSIISGLNDILKKYKKVVVFISGMATLTLVIVLMVSLAGLAAASGNPRDRIAYSKRTIICIIGIGLVGGFTIVFSLAFNVFR